MKIHAETDRWYMRDVIPDDVEDYLAMDKDPRVHNYLGNNPMTDIEQAHKAINSLLYQYKEHGIARWAVISKETDRFIGWSGVKYEQSPFDSEERYYDIGYRFHPDYWGKGFATETAMAALRYAFHILQVKSVEAAAHHDNGASNHILQKIGLRRIKSFMYQDIHCYWYGLSQREYQITDDET